MTGRGTVETQPVLQLLTSVLSTEHRSAKPPASFKKSIPTEQPDTRQRRTVARFMFLSRTPIMEPAAAPPPLT